MKVVTYTLEEKIRKARESCKEVREIRILVQEEKLRKVKIDEHDTLWPKIGYEFHKINRSEKLSFQGTRYPTL